MRVDRLISIIMILLDKQRVSAQTLADMFEVSQRTIYRDIDAIDLAGIPIRATSGVHGGFEIMPNYKLDKNVFSSADLTAILMGLSSVTNTMQGEEAINAIAKVKSFIPVDKKKEIECKTNQIHIDVTSWMGNQTIQPYLDAIKTALQEKRLLSFTYISLSTDKTKRTIEPYQLVWKHSHWYCQGYCLTRKDFRLFKLSRMINLQIQEEHFLPRELQRPQLEFNEMAQTMQTTIKLRIHTSILERLLDHCAYEQFIVEDDTHYLVDFPFIENDYHYDLLLSFGNQCECLTPAHIRKTMKQRIQNIAHLYDKS